MFFILIGDRNTITVKNENFKNNEKELNRISDNSRFDEVLKKVSKTIDCECNHFLINESF